MANSNNVTAPIEDDNVTATETEPSEIDKKLEDLEIKSARDIENLLNSEGYDEEVVEFFRSPLEMVTNDKRPHVKIADLSKSLYDVFLPFVVIPKMDDKGNVIKDKYITLQDWQRLEMAVDSLKGGFRIPKRKGGAKVDLHTAVNITAIRNVIATAVNSLNAKDVRKDSNGIAFSNGADKTKQVGKFTKITGKEKDLEFSLELVQKIKEVPCADNTAAPKEVDTAKKDEKTQEVVTN